VIDSGIESSHPEISGAITETFDAIAAATDEKSARGKEAGGDGSAHGTEVAGIIASHAALTGAAPQARLLGIRAFGKSGGRVAVLGTTYEILVGVDWAVKHKARVINMSFACPLDPGLSREVDEGVRRHVIFVAAVGNEGKEAKPLYPAAYENVIAVTATDQRDAIFERASRTGTCLAAPGVDVLTAAPAGSYKYDSGTSMAAAHVSGVTALLLNKYQS
jgi:subtilisin family serine protease